MKKKILPTIIISVILLLVAFWFDFADINYTMGKTIFPYKTAGWFVLSSPVLLFFCIAISMLYLPISKRIGINYTSVLMLILSISLVIIAAYTSHPFSRTKNIFGDKLSSSYTLNEFCYYDSFNGGSFANGIISANKQSINAIKDFRKLKSESTYLDDFKSNFESIDFPKKGIIYFDEHVKIYINEKDDKIFFFYQTREINNNT